MEVSSTVQSSQPVREASSGGEWRTLAVIPALDEHTKLQDVVTRTQPHVSHVVVVDDGSEEPLTKHLKAGHATSVIRHSINLGKGAAMKTGVLWGLERQFDAIVFLDGDGQHNPDEIPALLEPLRSERSDISFGVRKFYDRMPVVARLGNQFLTQALNLLYRIRVSDTQSGFRAIRLSRWPELEWDSSRYAVETEMIVNAGKHRLEFSEVPISTIYHDSYKGTTVIDGVRIMMNMIFWRFL